MKATLTAAAGIRTPIPATARGLSRRRAGPDGLTVTCCPGPRTPCRGAVCVTSAAGTGAFWLTMCATSVGGTGGVAGTVSASATPRANASSEAAHQHASAVYAVRLSNVAAARLIAVAWSIPCATLLRSMPGSPALTATISSLDSGGASGSRSCRRFTTVCGLSRAPGPCSGSATIARRAALAACACSNDDAAIHPPFSASPQLLCRTLRQPARPHSLVPGSKSVFAVRQDWARDI